MTEQINLEKRIKLKKAMISLVAFISMIALSKNVLADIIIGEKTGKNTVISNDLIVEGKSLIKDNINLSSGTINRDTNGVIISIEKEGRTITFSRNAEGLIESLEDDNYEWTLSRDVNGYVETWAGVKK